MTGMFRRARARVALLAPSTKARVESLPPRRRSQVAWLRGRLAEGNGARVLGVGRFDPALAAELVAADADIVDHRPLNREANIVADLAVDGAALAGPYDLVVAQEPGPASTRPDRLVPTLVAALADGGRIVLTTRPDDGIEAAVRAVGGLDVEVVPIRAGSGLEVSVR